MSVAAAVQYIVSTPGVVGGKPRLAGRRIAVQHVARWYGQQGLSAEEIAERYALSRAEVHAALSYYFDHEDEIDRQIAAIDAKTEEAWNAQQAWRDDLLARASKG